MKAKKKIFILIGSRQKRGNTFIFTKSIVEKLLDYDVEYVFPQDLKIQPCIGCQTCFQTTSCILKDDLKKLQDKMLKADILIIASPVYLHYVSGDLKIILDRLASWTHTMKLQGKPVVVLSTNDTNGHKSAVEPLCEIMTFMGGNVIANANASQYPNQIGNEEWISEVSGKISDRIKNYVELPPQSNPILEKVFSVSKSNILQQRNYKNEFPDIPFRELSFWEETGMINFQTFGEYLNSI